MLMAHTFAVDSVDFAATSWKLLGTYILQSLSTFTPPHNYTLNSFSLLFHRYFLALNNAENSQNTALCKNCRM
ncbi:hypothetical protein MTR67_018301 [Solanum verrucosum]|uniref:Uncharacterized protein n=1 Tax=Solanum verrucosum TaxID=315347 RepID=A0AAF0QKE4_SOLVR|nr:hypothetical protein MTR67_018301 [Solanum verrucosum]